MTRNADADFEADVYTSELEKPHNCAVSTIFEGRLFLLIFDGRLAETGDELG